MSQTPPPSDNENKPTLWFPLDELAKRASSEMNEEQLIHVPDFTLVQAMGATEIMDPKTDSGCGLPPTLDQCIKNLPNTPMSPHQVLSVMDRLWSCESQWLAGSTLAQTIYTCIFVLKRDCLQHSVLNAYITGLLRCCVHARDAMMRADLYSEGEFTAELHSFDLGFDCQDADVIKQLKTAQDEVNGVNASTKRKGKGKGKGKGKNRECSASNSEDWSSSGEHIRLIIAARISVLSLLLQAHIAFNEPQCTGIGTASRCLSQALEQLERVKALDEKREIETQVDTIVPPSSSQATLHLPHAPGFCFEINRPLLTLTPPRNVPECTYEMARDGCIVMCRALLKTCTVFDCESLSDFASFFAMMNSAHVLVRSRMFTLFYSEGKIFGRLSAAVLIQKDLGIPKPFLKMDKVQKSIQLFVEVFTPHLIRLFRTYARSPPMQHRKLANRHILEWYGVMERGKGGFNVINDLDATLMEAMSHNEDSEDKKNIRINIAFAWANDVHHSMMIKYLELCLSLELVSMDASLEIAAENGSSTIEAEFGYIIGHIGTLFKRKIDLQALMAGSKDAMNVFCRSTSKIKENGNENENKYELINSFGYRYLNAVHCLCNGLQVLHALLVHKHKREHHHHHDDKDGVEDIDIDVDMNSKLRFDARFLPLSFVNDAPSYEACKTANTIQGSGEKGEIVKDDILALFTAAMGQFNEGKKHVIAAQNLKQIHAKQQKPDSDYVMREFDILMTALSKNAVAAMLLQSAEAGKVSLNDRRIVICRGEHDVYPIVSLVK